MSSRSFFNLNLHMFAICMQDVIGKNTVFKKLEVTSDSTSFYGVKIKKNTMDDHFIIIKTNFSKEIYRTFETFTLLSIQFRKITRANTPENFRKLPAMNEIILNEELKHKLLNISLCKLDETKDKYMITMFPEIHINILDASNNGSPKTLYSVIFCHQSIIYQH